MATSERGKQGTGGSQPEETVQIIEWLRTAPLVRFFRWPMLPLALFLFILPPGLAMLGVLTALFR